MKTKLALRALATLLIVSSTGCFYYTQEPDFQWRLSPGAFSKQETLRGPKQWTPRAEVYTQRFVWKMKYLAQQMQTTTADRGKEGLSVLMTTITPVDNISSGTSFGRLVSEQLMTELNGRGFRVIEARKTNDYIVADKLGEFSLSRDLKKIAAEFSADAILVGTYSRAGKQILINVRLVDLRDSSTLGAGSALMDIRGDTFLQSVFGDNENERGDTPGGFGSVNLRKKVMPEVDHYSETLQAMIKNMAGGIAGGGPSEGGRG